VVEHQDTVAAVTKEAVLALLDKQAIHEVLMRYCRGVDRRDAELILSAFHRDAVDVHGGHNTSPAELAARVTGGAGGTGMMHFVGNEYVELDGDLAYSETYFISFSTGQRPSGETFTRTRAGRYLDRFERRAGEWRIAYRCLVDEWNRVDDVTQTSPNLIPSGIQSRDDLVYRLSAKNPDEGHRHVER
jgi:hypothetical protein